MPLIMSWGENDLTNDCLGGIITNKLCPGVKFSFLVIHRGCTAIKWNSPLRKSALFHIYSTCRGVLINLLVSTLLQ